MNRKALSSSRHILPRKCGIIKKRGVVNSTGLFGIPQFLLNQIPRLFCKRGFKSKIHTEAESIKIKKLIRKIGSKMEQDPGMDQILLILDFKISKNRSNS